MFLSFCFETLTPRSAPIFRGSRDRDASKKKSAKSRGKLGIKTMRTKLEQSLRPGCHTDAPCSYIANPKSLIKSAENASRKLETLPLFSLLFSLMAAFCIFIFVMVVEQMFLFCSYAFFLPCVD